MLTVEQLGRLPQSIDEFITSEPGKLTEIRQEFAAYNGRLNGVMKGITPEEVVDYLGYLKRKISPEERIAGIEQAAQSLDTDYRCDTGSIEPAELFFLSPFTNLEGKTLTRLPKETAANAIWARRQILRAFNHPFRIKVKGLYEADLKNRFPNSTPYDPLPPMNSPFLDAHHNEELYTYDEFVALIKPGRKVSRQLALAIGPYSVIGRHHVGLPIGSETMPDVVGNPIALSTLVRSHAKACAPRNNKFSNPEEQAKLINDTHRILEESSILEGREDKEEVMRQWQNNLGILVEPNPYKACKRIETVIKSLKPGRFLGYVRIYMVEGADEMVETAQIIHRYFPELAIDIGQVVNERQEKEIQELGFISSLGLGVTSGSRCSTAARSGIAGQNINDLYSLRLNGITLPVFGETGIPHHAMPVALAAGLSRINYSQGILGWLDANGHEWGFWDEKTKSLVHPYDGEAGPKAKYAEKRFYAWGVPIMLEGVDGWSAYDADFPTIAHRMWYLSESMVLDNTFHRHLFHEDLIYDPNIVITHMSEPLAAQVRPFQHF